MGADPTSIDNKMDNQDPFDDKDHLLSLLDEYQELNDIQQQERKEILSKIDTLTKKTDNLDELDQKLEQFLALLVEIQNQIVGISHGTEQNQMIPKPSLPKKPEIVATEEQIKAFSAEIDEHSERLNDEMESLVHLLEKKKSEIVQKDQEIEELNDKLDLLSDEKGRLANELENLNVVIDSWKSQLDLLQKLAASDPRYRVIEALKKHGSLSDIQLAFTMGTSINQLRKYIEDLIDLKLVQQSPNGRYIWTGKEFESDL